MAINSERLLKIVAGVFNAAPGSNYLPELEAFPGTELQFAQAMVATSIYTDSLGGASTPAEIGVILAGNFGLTADNVEGSPATDAIKFFTDGLAAGRDAGDLVIEAIDYLEDPSLDADFAPTAQLLSNKAAVAAAYSAAKGSSDLSVLQAAFAGVTGDAALTQAEIDAIVEGAEGDPIVVDPGTFTLTANNTVTEGDALTFTVTASEAVAADTDVVFTVVPDDTAAADQGTSSTNLNDFVQSTFNPVTVTIPAGSTTATFSVTAKDDGVTELPENFSVTAALASGGGSLSKTVSLQDGQSVTQFNLTTGADSITGTSNNDAINGLIGTGTTTTLTGADTINGGGGSGDILNITNTTGAGATNTNGALVSGVEVFNLRGSAAGDTFAFDGDNVSGATAINNYLSLGALTVTNVPSGASVGVVGNGSITSAATTATYVADATSAVLNISGGTKGAGAIGLTAAGATSLTINSTGAANTVGAISTASTGILSTTINAATSLATGGLAIGTNAAAQSLTVSGAATNVAATSTVAPTAAVVLGALDTDFASVDASGLTAGGVSAALSATVAATFTGGAGDDMITTSTSGQTGAVNAGEGNDKLILADATHIDSTAEGAIYTGFEVLSSAAAAIDMDLITGSTITAIEVGAAGSNVTDMNATQAANVTVIGALGATTLGIKDATQVGTADTLALTISDGDTTTSEALVAGGDLTLAGVETVTINAVDDATFTTMANITGMTSMTVTGGGDVSFTTGAHAVGSNAVFDFSALTGTSTFNAAAALGNAFAFTGGTAVDTVTDNVIGGNTISTGAGNDVITLTAKTGGTATTSVTGGAGADAITTAMIGSDANDLMKFNYAAGDSVSDATATGISATLTDTIAGFDGDTAAAAAGTSAEFDTEVAATAVTVGASIVAQNVVLGTTTVTNAGDFYVDITSATTANIYQDTDGDGIIEAGEFAVGLTGIATNSLGATDFTVVGGDLMLITL